jgi:hypothetical protein
MLSVRKTQNAVLKSLKQTLTFLITQTAWTTIDVTVNVYT